MLRFFFILLFIGSAFVSPAIALFGGILFALFFKNPYPKYSKIASKYLLQIAVVGLGFGMNLYKSLEAGKDAILFTIISVIGVMVLGFLVGKWFKIPPRLIHLISSGTAICGGSAIAAVSPVVNANENETTISLAVIFLLNALALFIFPPIGHALGLTQQQFGVWSAIAIHDTSSVVGASSIYGPQALSIATTVKLTRALWIIPLSLVSVVLFKKQGDKKIYIPWFIFLFVLAMVLNTYFDIPQTVSSFIGALSHKLLSITLFLIGSVLSINAIKTVGIKPIILGVTIWIIISITTLLVIA